MWDLRSRNRGIFVLISVLSGCAVLYNAWGPILGLTVSIIVVIYVCYCLLTNSSILSPRTLFFVKYLEEAGQEINDSLNTASFYLSSVIRKFSIFLNNYYRTHVASKMSRFRQNTYHLSNDTRDTSRNSSRFDLTTNPLSPIPKDHYLSGPNIDTNLENIPYNNLAMHRPLENNYPGTKHTSTPLGQWRKEGNLSSPNEGIGLFTPARPLRSETHHAYSPHRTTVNGNETVYSPNGSPWGTSISPKMRSKAGGVKTVQTVAGPLLASTRYNIDSKIYSDVTSPGLSSRLAKYATEANSKLTHQSQYLTGQFPKVNLNVSPLPLINMKNAKVRTPVTVRIAPPETNRYSPPEKQKLISDVCRNESRTAQNVVQVLREISLKRHASREDISAELVKKQRKEAVYEDNLDELAEMIHKRTREESPNTEEELFAKNNQLRPVKKSKTPSCYDVLNSLSSSNQLVSGVKRKASTYLSRSGTPDIEKHFKGADMVQTIPKTLVNVIQSEPEFTKTPQRNMNENSPDVVESYKKLNEQTTLTKVKSILKDVASTGMVVDNKSSEHVNIHEEKDLQTMKKSPSIANEPTNYTNKLFMKAEPQANERLRTLIQEQGNIRAKFTTDDVEEIKKQDIVNMRQTSMKARLQSMFDAISGKPTKKINPDVIIDAEPACEENTTATGASSHIVTLSSTTSTTNVNTSPIASSAVLPIIAGTKAKTTSKKHVTFILPGSQSSSSSSANEITPTGFQLQAAKSNSEVSNFSFGTLSTTTSSATSSPLSTQNTNTNTITAVTSTIKSSTTPPFPPVENAANQNSTPTTGSPSLNVNSVANNSLNTATTAPKNTESLPKSVTSTIAPNVQSVTPSSGNGTSISNKSIDNVVTNTQTVVPMSTFAFGTSKVSPLPSSVVGNNQSALAISQNQSSVPNSSTSTSQFSFNSTSTMPVNKPAATTSPVTFGGNNNAPAAQPTTGSFSFTTNTTASQSQPLSFGNTALTQSTPAFGSAGTQNPPVFGNSINFQNVQSPGCGATTITQNIPTFGSSQNSPAFGTAAVTTAQNPSTLGTVSSSAPPSAYGNNTSITSSSFTFGNVPQSIAATPALGASANSTKPSLITSAGSNATFSFGSSATAPSKLGFSFGGNAAVTSTGGAVTANPVSTFGATGNNATPVFGASSTSTTPSFGTPSTTAPPAFGTPSTTAPPAFGTPSTTAPPAFGAPSTTAPPAFGAPPSTAPPAYGTPSTTAPPAFGAQPTTTTPMFGGTSTTSTPVFGVTSSSATTSLFGTPTTTATSAIFNANASQSTFGSVANSTASGGFATPKTTAPPAFGSHTTDSGFNFGGVEAGRPSLFSGLSSDAAPSTTAPAATAAPVFGGSAASKNVFGQSKQPSNFAASPPTFGSSGTSNFGNVNTSFRAGNNTIAPAGNTSGFGTQNSTTPAFGASNTAAKPTSATSPPAFGSSGSTFGSTAAAPPAFGANTTSSSVFGSSATLFGSQNTASPSFGAATSNTPSAFGTNAAPAFGEQNTAAPPAFGTQNSGTTTFGASNSNANLSFGFGANQAQTQQNTGFSFSGASGTNNNTATVTPFQFGGTPAKTEGFNFSAPTTTPNLNFGATSPPSFGTMFGASSPAVPAGGMFNIGAGSTSSKSRSNRSRRQR
ncbi:nuclear pore complex protein DDB_G0274915 isoform X2 [Athalia rosae]|uniref:nuclear pore complex protein DDB_G0274915 isoform X2 n=1 Tax=Athalia rosae TaxID=37344 RepID=UPI0020337A9F|nr:nuclear pore complex protein DDB_G0274915 isoform X2 [Athalia rosae]